MNDKKSLSSRISQAFIPKGVKADRSILMSNEIILRGLSTENVENFFIGKIWIKPSPNNLLENLEDFWLLNSLGFYLFLPAYLKVILDHQDIAEQISASVFWGMLCPTEAFFCTVDNSLYLFSDVQKEIIRDMITSYPLLFDVAIEDNEVIYAFNLWSPF